MSQAFVKKCKKTTLCLAFLPNPSIFFLDAPVIVKPYFDLSAWRVAQQNSSTSTPEFRQTLQ